MRDEYADFLLSAFQSVEREIRKRGDRRYHQGEDLIQQLWVKLLEHRPRLNSPRKQILRMAANLGCDMDRRERLRRHAPLQDGAYERSGGGDALTNLVDHEDLEHLRRAIHKLRPRQHEAITADYSRRDRSRCGCTIEHSREHATNPTKSGDEAAEKGAWGPEPAIGRSMSSGGHGRTG